MFVYDYGITSYCILPGGITLYSAADEIEVNRHAQNTTMINCAKKRANWHRHFKEVVNGRSNTKP